ncbi:MAG: hypothetical protein JXA52_05250 [Planctomycetes bacterium]|nr:hypothetical protein [Planctomycetota bacterium]
MPWVEISQAAFMMGISERTIRNWVKSGKISAKTENGRRMVEIPDEELRASGADAEPFPEDDAFQDTEESQTDIMGAQKRLEVALLECGRVKGTLASQERIMETLSSNIGELTAKLQKSQNRAWKFIIVSLVVASIGLVVVLINKSAYYEKEGAIREDHTKALELKNQTILELNKEKSDRRWEFLTEMNKREKELEEEKKQALKEQEEEFEGQIEKAEEKVRAQLNDIIDNKDNYIRELQDNLKQETFKVAELEAKEAVLKEDITELEAMIESKNLEIMALEEVQTRYLELQKRIIDKEILKDN